MKGMRKRGRSPQRAEECGVWLDTAELKRRPHQTVIPCTSSSRLNPHSSRRPIDSAMLEFTQTKTVQLCTKQTSMYSFFVTTGKKDKDTQKLSINSSVEEKCFSKPCNKRELAAYMRQEYIFDGPAVCQEAVDSCKSYKNLKQPTHSEQNGKEAISIVQDLPAKENNVNDSNGCLFSGTDKKPACLLDFTSSKEEYSKEVNQCSTSWLNSHLLTQDTQGNKVICHRFVNEDQRKHNMFVPLHDRTNITRSVASPLTESHPFVCDEVPLHKMFTQDSEGNMVIKH